jgi:alanine-synthesizing transaminase
MRGGLRVIDLTVSNPTVVGLDYPLDDIAAALESGARASYSPDPRGLLSARQAVAEHLRCHPDDLLLTASTSEAYSFLFRLLADPGDDILTAVPGYPLFDHLAQLDSIGLRTYPLELQRRWEIHPETILRAITPRTRALVLVSPNNPTGSIVTEREQGQVAELCRDRQTAIISDEVFAEYVFDAPTPSFAVRDDVLSFSLGGLSKSGGLPHLKLAWIRVGGPPAERREAIETLELIADSYLSVGTPVQAALPRMLEIGGRIRASISSRIRQNLATLRAAAAAHSAITSLPVEGGWTAVLRVPRVVSDDQLAVGLLERAGVLVHPGYFFDFPSEGFLVLSLLPAPAEFEEGLRLLFSEIADLG